VLVCPRCKKSLEIVKTLHLGPDGSSDEYNFQLVRCAHCQLHAAGAYEESRRGSDASWHHDVIEIDRGDWNRIHGDIERCSTPETASCTCEIHKQYGETDESDYHRPLRGMHTIGTWLPIESVR